MRALAICGSPRVGGNTQQLLVQVLDVLAGEGIAGELVHLGEKTVLPCKACGACARTKDGTCAIKTDDMHEILAKMLAADIIVVGSPVYFGSATPQIMALLDRTGYVSRQNNNPLSRKVGGALVVARRAGQNFTFAQLMYWFLINEMIVPGSSYWNIAFGLKPGDVADDAEGQRTVGRFAENLAWVAQKLQA